jgi:uncharacterized membrane protein
MTPGFAVFILMNNYFHDVATTMLLACGIAMLLIIRQLGNGSDAATLDYFSRLFRGVHRLAWISVAWILVGGIPRVLTFNSFEWANAVEKHHEAGLIAKYVIAVFMMVLGAYLWAAQLRKLRDRGIRP